MKKYLTVFFLAIITCTADAGWHIYPEDGCAILPWVWPAHWGRDDYYFCGAHKTTCNNDSASDDELEHSTAWFNHKDYATLDDTRYWCCDGKVTSKPTKSGTASGTPGRWVKGTDWIVDKETKEIIVSGGKCSYEVKKDVCGNIDDSDKRRCASENITKEKLSCPSGTIFRESTKSCVTLCKPGFVFESKTSDRCVECAETATQGIAHDEGKTDAESLTDSLHQVCRKCNSASQLFDPKKRICVEKTNTTSTIALSMTDLQYGKGKQKQSKVADNCWTKFNNEYKDCVLGTTGK